MHFLLCSSNNFDFFLPPTASGRYHAFPEQWMVPEGAKNAERLCTDVIEQRVHASVLNASMVVSEHG